jgi:hypothetical protein
MDRSDRRRQPTWHRRPGIHDHDEVRVDIAECRALLLDSGRALDDVSRLMLEIAVRHGGGVMTFGELKGLVHGAVSAYGSVKAAIKAARRKQRP